MGSVERFNGATGAFIDTFIPAGRGAGRADVSGLSETSTAVPEPAVVGPVGLGLLGFGVTRSWRKR